MEPTYQSEQIGQLGAALAAAQSRFTFAAKTSSASMGMGKARTYADLQSVLDACRAPLSDNGLAVVQTTLPCNDGGVTIRTTLIHKSNEWIAGELHLPPDKMGGIQGMGSAITYGRRYAYAAIVGIAQDDDDGECAQQAARTSQRKQTPKSAPAPERPVSYSAQAAPAAAPAPAPVQPQTVSFSDRAKAAQDALAKQREEAERNNPEPPSENLRKAFIATLRDQGLGLTNGDREQTLGELSREIGRTILSTKAITATEMHAYLDRHSKRNEPAPGYGTF